jgi:hypothetical protein
MFPILGYFSPETLLPATSIIATALGFIMLIGRGSYRLMVRGWRLAANRSHRIANTSEPHLHRAAELHQSDAYTYATPHAAAATD